MMIGKSNILLYGSGPTDNICCRLDLVLFRMEWLAGAVDLLADLPHYCNSVIIIRCVVMYYRRLRCV